MKKVFLSILIFFLCFNIVNASEHDVYVNAVFLKDPEYYQYKVFDKKVMAAPGNNLFANGNLVYCLEPDILITEAYYKVSESLLDKETEHMVSLIGYYGYGYKNHTHEYYRVATQHLIWEYLGLVKEVYITSDNNGKNRIDISSYKSEIMNLVNSHSNMPSFARQKIIAYYGEEIKIVDNNSVLKLFEINSNLNYRINNNELFITIDFLSNQKIGLVKDLVVRQKNEYYISGSSQKLMRIGEVKPLSSYFEIEVLSGEIEINKRDNITKTSNPEGRSLEGAVYALYNENKELIKEVTTDKNGEAILLNLALGKYFIKELTPSVGYILDENIYEIEITKENLKHIVVSYEVVYVEPIVYIEMPNTFIS